MEDYGVLTIFYWISSLLLFFLITGLLSKHRNSISNSLPLPGPGPRGLPIIGHLFTLGDLPYRTLHKWSQKYGPIMRLRFGMIPAVVVSSPEAVELFLRTHDVNFSNRPRSQHSECTSLGSKGMLYSQYGPYFHDLRKWCTVHLFSAPKIESFRPLRKEEVKGFVQNLKQAAEGREVVNITSQVVLAIEKITCRMILGTSEDKDRLTVKPMIEECLRLANAFNLNDYFPFPKAFDIQGLTRRTKTVIKNMDDFLDKMIDEHEKDYSHQDQQKDFMDVMMSLMKPDDGEEKLDRTSIKVVTMDLLGAAWETTAATIEWALKEILRHPEVMKRVQEELETVIGMDRMVEETDLVKLHYLDMVVKESMRLHPFAPLIPRESIEDVSINGFHIPHKSQVIINVWAINRDPAIWSDNSHEFYPERFANTGIDVRGLDYQVIPFGAGRRKCPGVELGFKTVHFFLAQLLHCFNLELPYGVTPKNVDMKESFGDKANPLFIVPTYRLCF